MRPALVQGASPASRLVGLAAHLDRCYDANVAAVEQLDVGVYRIERRGGTPWVARVFPASRPFAAVEGDAEILRRLGQAGFPAERCADPEPLSTLDGAPVLVRGSYPARGPARVGGPLPCSASSSAACKRGQATPPCGPAVAGTT